jgi:hypothetical protein
MLLNSDGNLGLGVTPSAWDGTLVKAIQLADNGASLSSFSTGNTSGKFAILSNNAYYDSGGWKYLQSSASAQYRIANQEHQWFTAASGTAGNAISFTQAMTLDASGNLGIGTTSPARLLHVNGETASFRLQGTTNGGYIEFVNPTNTNYIGSPLAISSGNTTDMSFWVSSSERMRITSAGNVGIACTPNFGRVEIQGSTTDKRLYIGTNAFYSNSIDVLGINSSGSEIPLGIGGSQIQYYTGATERMRITSAGNVGIGTTSPIDSNRLTVLMDGTTNGTGIAIKAVNDGGIGSQPALSYFNGSGNLIAKIVADNGTGFLGFNTGTSNAERMRITSGGDVGIGTTSPTGRLTLSREPGIATITGVSDLVVDGSSTNGILYLNTYSTGNTIICNGGGNVGIGTTSPDGKIHGLASNFTNSQGFLFEGFRSTYSASSPVMYIKGLWENDTSRATDPILKVAAYNDSNGFNILHNGNVGIGTQTPNTKLFVTGASVPVNISSSDNTLCLGLGYQGTMHGYIGGISSALYAYSTNGGYVLLNSSSVWVSASDAKRKRNFENYHLGLDAVLALEPKLYNMDFQKDGDDKQVGLVAQEVKECIPHAYEQSDDFIGLNYNAIIVTMVNAIKELKAEIDILKNK